MPLSVTSRQSPLPQLAPEHTEHTTCARAHRWQIELICPTGDRTSTSEPEGKYVYHSTN